MPVYHLIVKISYFYFETGCLHKHCLSIEVLQFYGLCFHETGAHSNEV